jgi:hypothetical protein
MIENVLSSIENELYELVGKIDYGEISDIDASWSSLTESLLQLNDFGYHIENEGYLSLTLEPLKALMDPKLISIADEMEDLCQGGGSSDSIDEDDIERLQDMAEEFERLFLAFTQRLREKS